MPLLWWTHFLYVPKHGPCLSKILPLAVIPNELLEGKLGSLTAISQTGNGKKLDVTMTCRIRDQTWNSTHDPNIESDWLTPNLLSNDNISINIRVAVTNFKIKFLLCLLIYKLKILARGILTFKTVNLKMFTWISTIRILNFVFIKINYVLITKFRSKFSFWY